jgi:hypothetical protein
MSLQLCRENPHYLEFRGRPMLLIGSGEHYGQLLNLDFDYDRYLHGLQRDGMNQTRVFSGTYREIPGSFGIAENTLAPVPGRLICPWARSDTPGYVHGGNKFDLSRWDDAYFARLRDIVEQAGRRNVVIEMVLFCFLYNDDLWAASPMHAAANVNGIGDVPRSEVYTLRHPRLLKAQEDVVRRIAAELRGYDNVYFEIMNEPYCNWDLVDFRDWQHHIIDVLAAEEKALGARHLIAQGIYNRRRRIVEPHPEVSIFNFHYTDPGAVGDNYHLNCAIADDETGFEGTICLPYRREAWQFILAGGGIFSHLDYSFTVAHPDGTAPIAEGQPGFGGPEWRRQLGILRDFMKPFDLTRLHPSPETLPEHAHIAYTSQILADPGRAYAIYLHGGAPQVKLRLALPTGRYRAEWVHPITGAATEVAPFNHTGGLHSLLSPEYEQDMALKVLASRGRDVVG